jgi:hypothetical protein
MRKALVLFAVLGLVGFVGMGDVTGGPGESSVMAVLNGDVNGDQVIDISDPVHLMNFMFIGGPPPAPLACEPFAAVHNGDIDGSGAYEITDPIRLLNYLFQGGPEPVEGCPKM